jgi:XTP/dITP diphosphohydrolase
VCAVAYVDGERRVLGRGATGGRLVLPPRGDAGFGWDPVFQPDESARTYGEMSPEEKDTISHRGRAWRALAVALADAGIEI